MAFNGTRGLLLVYGTRLPAGGVAFLAPVSRLGNLTRVPEAMRVCAERWPHPDRRRVYADTWADGSLSTCDDAKDRALVWSTKAWDNLRYEWDFDKQKFVLMDKP